MAVTDTKLRNLKPRHRAFQQSVDGGLFLEVMPGGAKAWRLRYRLGGKQEKATLGDYPTYSLAEACTWRDECKALARRGVSPMRLKRGDVVPEDTLPVVKEIAESFVRKWCVKSLEKKRALVANAKASDLVEVFIWRWYEDIVVPANKHPRNIKRVLEKDIIPSIGAKRIADVSVDDILRITDSIKARGSDHMALQTRNVLKRLFAYAIARQKTQFNPAAAIQAKYIAVTRSRDVALTADEIGRLLRCIYQSSMRRANKLALHLLVICMVRKSELIEAQWTEIDFEEALWSIPGDRMKKDRPHLVPLSTQAVAMLQELKGLSGDSPWILPSRNTSKKPISKTTLNAVVRTLNHDVQDFVIHDFRRTASTHLHESGFNSDWIEKALAHETRGVRGMYNKAEYLTPRQDMLQWWANFVDAQIDEGRNVVIGRFGKMYQANG